MTATDTKPQIPQWLDILSRLATIVIAIVALITALASVNFFVVRSVVSEQVIPQFQQIDQRFQLIDQRFQQIDQRFQQIDQRFQQVDQRLERIESKLDNLKK